MVNWFGTSSWGAPICADSPRCETPTGTPCAHCRVRFLETDIGLTIPGDPGPVAFHLDCWSKTIMPHTKWESLGLVPKAYDGLGPDGIFTCRTCKVTYNAHTKRWSPWVMSFEGTHDDENRC
jgi:hypothetical protein